MISSHLVGVNALGQVHREVRQYAARPLLPQNILYFSWNLIFIYSNFSLNLDIHKRIRLRALLFDLWPFENSTGPWEGLRPPSQYLSIQPIY